MNTSAQNSTADDSLIPLITIITWFTIFSIFATLFFNFLFVLVYFTKSDLRTPFNAYIVNIAITEMLLALTAMPGSVIRGFHGGEWPYNAVSCTFLLYAQQIFGTGIRYGHLLVTINRVWAVTFPIHYRTAQTKRVAWALIGATWVYLHVLSLTMIFRGRLLKGTQPTDPACNNNDDAHFAESLAVEIIGFDLPELIILVTYPYIVFKLRRRKTGRFNRIQPNLLTQTLTDGLRPTIISSHGKEIDKRRPTGVDLDIPANLPARGSSFASKIAARSQDRLLGYFVLGVLICWTPNHVFYLRLDITGQFNHAFYGVQYFLQYTYSWVNPILCYLAMRQIRTAINSQFRCCRGR